MQCTKKNSVPFAGMKVVPEISSNRVILKTIVTAALARFTLLTGLLNSCAITVVGLRCFTARSRAAMSASSNSTST
jgi:hypothetical protein